MSTAKAARGAEWRASCMLKTPFWRKAAASLPANIRARHLGSIEQAERWELALDRALEAWARMKSSFAQPRGAH